MNVPDNDWLTIHQAAALLGVSEVTLRRWDRSGKLIAERHPATKARLYSCAALLEGDRPAATLAVERVVSRARPFAARSAGVRTALRMLAAARSRGSLDAPAGWLVGPEASWIRAPDGRLISLVRRGPLRRVLDALVEQRLSAPGRALGAVDLLAAGWPDAKLLFESGMQRVRWTVATLRSLGLRSLLVTGDEGYMLDAAAPVRRVAETGPPHEAAPANGPDLAPPIR